MKRSTCITESSIKFIEDSNQGYILYHLCWKDWITLPKADLGNSIVVCTGLWRLSFADVKDENQLSDAAEEIDDDINSLLSLLPLS